MTHKNIFSTDAIMRSLENLNYSINLFDITKEQEQEILQRMSRCDRCQKWQFLYNLHNGKCEKCSGKPRKVSSLHSNKPSGTSRPKKKKKAKKKPSDALTKKAEERFMKKIRKMKLDIYYRTVYLTIKDYLMRGMQITQAVECAGMKQSEYNKLPKVYKDRLMALKKAKTAQMRNS